MDSRNDPNPLAEAVYAYAREERDRPLTEGDVRLYRSIETGESCGECGRDFAEGERAYYGRAPTSRRSFFGDVIRESCLLCSSCSHWGGDRPLDGFAWWQKKNCPVCGRLVIYETRHERTALCSRACRRVQDAERKRDERALAREDRASIKCDTCGETFTPTRSDSRYCSAKCRQKAYRTRKKGA